MNADDEAVTRDAHKDKPDLGRRNLLKITSAGVAAFGTMSLFTNANAEAQTMSEEWDKVFPRSGDVAFGGPGPRRQPAMEAAAPRVRFDDLHSLAVPLRVCATHGGRCIRLSGVSAGQPKLA